MTATESLVFRTINDFCNKICQSRLNALQQKTQLFDHLVGEREQIVGDLEAERLGGPEVDHELELGRLQNRQVGGLGPLENVRGVDAVLPVGVGDADAVAEQSARHGIFSELVDGGQALPLREIDNAVTPRVEIRVRADQQRVDALLDQRGEGGIEFLVNGGFHNDDPLL